MWTADEHYGPLLGPDPEQPTATQTHAAGTPERNVRTVAVSTGLRDNPVLFLIVLAAAAFLLLRFSVHGDVSVGVGS